LPKPALSIERKAAQYLESVGLKKTPLRAQLMVLLIGSKQPLSQVDIIQHLSQQLDSVDRVTVYRNLKQLKKLDLVHEVDVNQYIFCEHDCDQHAHLLFFCTKCQSHSEVRDHKKIHSFLALLGEFQFFGQNEPISLRGVCARCQVR
jgi:Fur family transcriptional regulator, ferric uptake regulator